MNQLFELENDRGLLDYSTYDGVPLWMMARQYMFLFIKGKIEGIEYPVRNRRIETKMVKNVVLTQIHNYFDSNKGSTKEIILYTTNRKTILGGKYYNRYADFFSSVFPNKSLVIEQAMLGWEWPFPRWNENVIFDTIARIRGEILSRLRYRKDYPETYKLVQHFNKRCQQLFGIQLSQKEMVQCATHIAQLVVSSRHQAEWLENQLMDETKLVITVGAGFPFYYFVNRMLKRKKIVSVELQHGWITKNNTMYNYHPSIVEDIRVGRGLPTYMMTYGSWWNRQMNCPIQKVEIGNPWRTYCKYYGKQYKHKEKKIMVIIGTGITTAKYIELTKNLQKNFQDYSVWFRPHPGEYKKALQVSLDAEEMQIDTTTEIYDTLFMADIIISEVSTVLFEAIGIVERIFVWKTEVAKFYFDEHPFEEFHSVDELKKILKKKAYTYNNEQEFWASNWRQRYMDFIALM